MTHICVTKLTIIGSDNGLSPGRRRPIVWTNAGILLDPMNTFQWHFNRNWNSSLKKMHLKMSYEKCRPLCRGLHEGIRQYDSCNTGELDRHAQHQQPCLASRTPRVVVRQKQPVLSGTHCSSFVHRQMSVVFCLQRFPMKIENCHIRHQRPPR